MKFALISLTNKDGLIDIAKTLFSKSYSILSTGGTAKFLKENNIPVTDIPDYTGFPEIFDGRVKTLHPKIHGGILFRRNEQAHITTLQNLKINPIDIVLVNLYPFEQVCSLSNSSEEQCIENIDIGGPALLRSAAKNYEFVTVLCDPRDYAELSKQITELGHTTLEFRRYLASKAFQHTAYYDSLIAKYFKRNCNAYANNKQELEFSEILTWPMRKAATLRYGENPHQRAALYGNFQEEYIQLQGKELSYNNILDTASALDLIYEFDEPTLAILKHTNPCGVAQGATLLKAWEKAYATDREAPFGGIIVMNRECDRDVASAISEVFSEVVIAPGFDEGAKEVFLKKKNLRLLQIKPKAPEQIERWHIRSVRSGWLVQDADIIDTKKPEWRCVTKREPSSDEWSNLVFAWKVVKHVKSNAIVFAKDGQTLGIGAGQMSRVDASRIAVWKAGQSGLDLKGSVAASDAFFPFADGVIAAANAGTTAFIQPGGSIRDQEVIQACDERGLAMVFTGERHFRH